MEGSQHKSSFNSLALLGHKGNIPLFSTATGKVWTNVSSTTPQQNNKPGKGCLKSMSCHRAVVY